jgi:hypothetical protein
MLTPICIPHLYVLFVVTYNYGEAFVSLLVFSSTISISPFPRYLVDIFNTKIEKNRILKESPTQHNWKVCRLGLIEPVHGRYWKVQVTVHAPPSTGLSRIQHLTRKWSNFEFRNIRRCVHTAVIMEPLMWHSSAIPWKAAYGPQVKECFCPKWENNGRN